MQGAAGQGAGDVEALGLGGVEVVDRDQDVRGRLLEEANEVEEGAARLSLSRPRRNPRPTKASR